MEKHLKFLILLILLIDWSSAEKTKVECLKDAGTFKTFTPKKGAESSNKKWDVMIDFFKDCIVDPYKFGLPPKEDEPTAFDSVPTFEEPTDVSMLPYGPYFKEMSAVAQAFFGSWKSWGDLKSKYAPQPTGNEKMKCKRMLWISAARYLFYIDVLTKKDYSSNIILCEQPDKDHMYIPRSVCYPEQAGSLTCTSDADVGLVGPEAGIAVQAFNKYFTDTFGKTCGDKSNEECTSDVLLDNNMYAFSLEYSVPEMFLIKDPQNNKQLNQDYKLFESILDKQDKSPFFQWRDIGFALLQVKRTNVKFYDEYRKYLESKKLGNGAVGRMFKSIDQIDFQKGTEAINMYSGIVAEMKKENAWKSMMQLLKSHVYASEAYHSKGAMRAVVVAMQMKKSFIQKRLSMNDYWATMIENWGFAIKGIKCQSRNMEELQSCFTSNSKYLWRFFTCMNSLRNVAAKSKLSGDVTNLPDPKDLQEYFEILLFRYNKRKESPPLKIKSYDGVAKDWYKELTEWGKGKDWGGSQPCANADCVYNKLHSVVMVYMKHFTEKFNGIPLGKEQVLKEDMMDEQNYKQLIDLPTNKEYFEYVTQVKDKVDQKLPKRHDIMISVIDGDNVTIVNGILKKWMKKGRHGLKKKYKGV